MHHCVPSDEQHQHGYTQLQPAAVHQSTRQPVQQLHHSQRELHDAQHCQLPTYNNSSGAASVAHPVVARLDETGAGTQRALLPGQSGAVGHQPRRHHTCGCACCDPCTRRAVHMVTYGMVSAFLLSTGFVFSGFALFAKESEIAKVWLAGPTTIAVGLVLFGKVLIDCSVSGSRDADEEAELASTGYDPPHFDSEQKVLVNSLDAEYERQKQHSTKLLRDIAEQCSETASDVHVEQGRCGQQLPPRYAPSPPLNEDRQTGAAAATVEVEPQPVVQWSLSLGPTPNEQLHSGGLDECDMTPCSSKTARRQQQQQQHQQQQQTQQQHQPQQQQHQPVSLALPQSASDMSDVWKRQPCCCCSPDQPTSSSSALQAQQQHQDCPMCMSEQQRSKQSHHAPDSFGSRLPSQQQQQPQQRDRKHRSRPPQTVSFYNHQYQSNSLPRNATGIGTGARAAGVCDLDARPAAPEHSPIVQNHVFLPSRIISPAGPSAEDDQGGLSPVEMIVNSRSGGRGGRAAYKSSSLPRRRPERGRSGSSSEPERYYHAVPALLLYANDHAGLDEKPAAILRATPDPGGCGGAGEHHGTCTVAGKQLRLQGQTYVPFYQGEHFVLQDKRYLL